MSEREQDIQFTIRRLYDELDAARREIQELKAERDALRETNSRLNRRCQLAERAAKDTVEKVERAGMSLGRGLANWSATHYKDRSAELEAALLEIAEMSPLDEAQEAVSIARNILNQEGVETT